MVNEKERAWGEGEGEGVTMDSVTVIRVTA